MSAQTAGFDFGTQRLAFRSAQKSRREADFLDAKERPDFASLRSGSDLFARVRRSGTPIDLK
jgi:hypothetical protein